MNRKVFPYVVIIFVVVAGLFSAELRNGSLVQIGSTNYCADAGSTDTYACNLPISPVSYQDGACYLFKANTANTGAATINFNGIGAITIKKAAGGITTDLADNDIRANQKVQVCYDGTNMQMQSTLGNAGGGGAPTTAGYWTKTADGTLSNEFDMSSLATGIVRNANGTGVPSIAVAADMPSIAPAWWMPRGETEAATISNAWSANQTRVYGFVSPVNQTFTKLGWYVGTSNGNYIMSIWNAAGTTVICQTASTASAANAQIISTTATCTLAAGTEYRFLATSDSGTFTVYNYTGSASNGIGEGIINARSATAFGTANAGSGSGAGLLLPATIGTITSSTQGSMYAGLFN